MNKGSIPLTISIIGGLIVTILIGMAVVKDSAVEPLSTYIENYSQLAVISSSTDIVNITVGSKNIKAELADTLSEHARGLSGREKLDSGTGMLFVFDTPGNYPFWMKDMLILIDIIWIDENKKAVSIDENVATSTYPNAFFPPSLIKYVLELPAGQSAEYGISIGSDFIF